MKKKITVTRSYCVDIPEDKISMLLENFRKTMEFDVTLDMLFMHLARNAGNTVIDGVGDPSSFGIKTEVFHSSVDVLKKNKKSIT